MYDANTRKKFDALKTELAKGKEESETTEDNIRRSERKVENADFDLFGLRKRVREIESKFCKIGSYNHVHFWMVVEETRVLRELVACSVLDHTFVNVTTRSRPDIFTTTSFLCRFSNQVNIFDSISIRLSDTKSWEAVSRITDNLVGPPTTWEPLGSSVITLQKLPAPNFLKLWRSARTSVLNHYSLSSDFVKSQQRF